jgi:3-isopropylmalate/(R)-2-methylmalate dehydratase large subunit
LQQVDEGLDLLHVDRHYVHEMTSPRAFTSLRDRGIEVLSPELTFGSPEHTPARSD